ncbi:aminopeptidase [Paenibacillus sp. 453mf]|uniref:aminopeptidase n=1 Tax=Paenibacillus sp. 453mf TaxID=1761874 RepID=UPI0008EF2887|nr:aminopeptidase [Paenibacillus sp. 453mf]SFS37547.1 Leucyl aminopeptidase (aminopeptidase T) [Paenibacillus sp. 453mf]
MDFQTKLNNYAELLVKVGVNVQQGQTVVLNISIDFPELARAIVKKSYEAGAYKVKVNWSDDAVSRIQYDMGSEESFLDVPTHAAAERIEQAENGAAFITIKSDDPDLLAGVSPQKIINANKTASNALTRFRQLTQSFKVSWTLGSAPSAGWATKVFPDVPEEEAVAKLWDAIFQMVRADQPDPIAAWEKHVATLKEKSSYLNSKQYKQLHFIGPGTDLKLDLPENHVWLGGNKENEKGVWFVPNLPTEEVYSAPFRTGVNGTVSSTKPLSYSGNIIDNFTFTFENGRVTKVTAEKGEETLKGLVGMDDGSHYLGEVALVPHHSPISDSNILFYKTLFDENASCHLAIGSAYSACVEGGTELSPEELRERGLNTSVAHTDFMIGSGKLDIIGITKDGKEEAVFKQGNWAF